MGERKSLQPPRRRPATEIRGRTVEVEYPVRWRCGIDVCMTGPANGAQLDEALATLDAGPLTSEEEARIRRIGAFVRYPSHPPQGRGSGEREQYG